MAEYRMPGMEIIQFRREHGRMSRAELARRIPVPYRTLQDWENDTRPAPAMLRRTLQDIAWELGKEGE